jgi:hypothetical protein
MPRRDQFQTLPRPFHQKVEKVEKKNFGKRSGHAAGEKPYPKKSKPVEQDASLVGV